MSLVKKICYSIKENIEKQMAKSPKPLNNLQIRKIVNETVSYFVWINKHKKPIIRSTIFDENANSVQDFEN